MNYRSLLERVGQDVIAIVGAPGAVPGEDVFVYEQRFRQAARALEGRDCAEVQKLAGAAYVPHPARAVLAEHLRGELSRNLALTALHQLSHEVRTNEAALHIPHQDAWPRTDAPLTERFAQYAAAVDRVAAVTGRSQRW